MTLPVPTIDTAVFPQARAPIATVSFDGRPWWIARQVGAALGYKRPSDFPKLILNRWADRMKPTIHYLLLEGDVLRAFKEAVGKAENSPLGDRQSPGGLFGGRASSLLLLTEAGLYRSILYSKSSVGDALMDFLTLEVLPMIRRCGVYLPSDHPLRPVVSRLAGAGFFAPTPEDDQYEAYSIDLLKMEVSGAMAKIHAALARRTEFLLRKNGATP